MSRSTSGAAGSSREIPTVMTTTTMTAVTAYTVWRNFFLCARSGRATSMASTSLSVPCPSVLNRTRCRPRALLGNRPGSVAARATADSSGGSGSVYAWAARSGSIAPACLHRRIAFARAPDEASLSRYPAALASSARRRYPGWPRPPARRRWRTPAEPHSACSTRMGSARMAVHAGRQQAARATARTAPDAPRRIVASPSATS